MKKKSNSVLHEMPENLIPRLGRMKHNAVICPDGTAETFAVALSSRDSRNSQDQGAFSIQLARNSSMPPKNPEDWVGWGGDQLYITRACAIQLAHELLLQLAKTT